MAIPQEMRDQWVEALTHIQSVENTPASQEYQDTAVALVSTSESPDYMVRKLEGIREAIATAYHRTAAVTRFGGENANLRALEQIHGRINTVQDLIRSYRNNILRIEQRKREAERLKQMFDKIGVVMSNDLPPTHVNRYLVVFDMDTGEFKVYDTLFSAYIFEAGETPSNVDEPKRCLKYVGVKNAQLAKSK